MSVPALFIKINFLYPVFLPKLFAAYVEHFKACLYYLHVLKERMYYRDYMSPSCTMLIQ